MKVLRENVFMRLLIPVLFGIAFSTFFLPTPFTLNILWLATLFLFTITVYIHSNYLRFNIFLNAGLPGLSLQLFILFFFCTVTLSRNPASRPDYFAIQKADAFIVRITSEPHLKGELCRFEVTVKKRILKKRTYSSSGKIILSVGKSTGAKRDYLFGEHLLIPACFDEIEGPKNPFEFDYRGYMSNYGVRHQAFLKPYTIRRIGYTFCSISGLAIEWRKKMVAKINKYVLNKDASSVTSTLLLGYKAELSQDILSAYSKTGAMHVLSVSGMHVTLIMVMSAYLLGFINNSRFRILHITLILLIIWTYTLISGFSAAACRAAIMISFVVIAKALKRNNNMLNCIAASAFLQLLYNPLWFFDIGFQLSYLAVFGLIIFYADILRLIKTNNWLGEKMGACIALSLSAQIATFPLCLYYFNQFPVYFLLSNIFIALPVTFIMYIGIAFLIIPIKSISILLGWVLERCSFFLNGGLYFIEKMPYASLHGFHYPVWVYISLYVLIVMLCIMIVKKKKSVFFHIGGLLLILISINAYYRYRQLQFNYVVFHSLRESLAISLIEKGEGFVFSDLKRENRAISYSVWPLFDRRNLQLKHYSAYDGSFMAKNLIKYGKICQFRNWKLLIFDESSQHFFMRDSICFDVIYLHGNPTVALNDLKKRINFRFLIIGNKNSDRQIEEWQREAKVLKLKYYVLKNARAVEIPIP